MIGDLPKGTQDIRLNGFPSDESYNRDTALWEREHITPNQEETIVTFWNLNFGNQDLTAAAVKAFYEQQHLPLPADIDTAVEEAKTGMRDGKPFAGYKPYDFWDEQQAYYKSLEQAIKDSGEDPENVLSAFGNHVYQGVTFEAGDEIDGVLGAIKAAVHLRNPIDGYRFSRDVSRRTLEQNRKAHPYVSAVGEILGGAATGKAGAGSARTASELAGTGVKMGTIVGVNSGEGALDSTVKGGLGGLAGGAASYGTAVASPYVTRYVSPYVERAVNAFKPNRFTAEEVAAQAGRAEEMIDAGLRRNVPTRAAEADPVRRAQAIIERASGRGKEIFAAADAADEAAIRHSVATELAGAGTPVQDRALGNKVGRALDRMAQERGRAFDATIGRVQKAAGTFRAPAPETLATLDDLAARAERTGLTGQAAALRELRGDFADGMTLGQLRGLPRRLAELEGKAGLPPGALGREGALMQLKAEDELVAAMRAGGLGRPAKALERALRGQRADRDFSATLGELFDASGKALGGAKVARTIRGWAQGGDYGKLRQVYSALDAPARADLRASLAAGLGTDAEGRFSLETFLKATIGDKNTPPQLSRRAQRLIFGRDGMAALADLRLLATEKLAARGTPEELAAAAAGPGNLLDLARGKLGGELAGAGLRTAVLRQLLPGPAAGAANGLLDKLGPERAARLLTNPDFTKWLREMPEATDPEWIDRYFQRFAARKGTKAVLKDDLAMLRQLLPEGLLPPPPEKPDWPDEADKPDGAQQ